MITCDDNHWQLPEHSGFDFDSRVTQTVDPPTPEEIDRDLGYEVAEENDEIENMKAALSTFLQWLTSSSVPDIIFQKMVAAAWCVDTKLLVDKTASTICERYRIASTGELSNHARTFRIFVGEECGKSFGAVFRCVFSSTDRDCAEQKTLVFVAMVRPGLLSISTIPGMAKMLGNLKQGIHHHVKSFRQTFNSHRFERGGNVKKNQSAAALASWERRKARAQAQP